MYFYETIQKEITKLVLTNMIKSSPNLTIFEKNNLLKILEEVSDLDYMIKIISLIK